MTAILVIIGIRIIITVIIARATCATGSSTTTRSSACCACRSCRSCRAAESRTDHAGSHCRRGFTGVRFRQVVPIIVFCILLARTVIII